MNGLVAALRVILGGLLVVAGSLKVGHATDLASTIASFRLVPGPAAALLALFLPYFEILVGVYLVIGLFTRIAAVVAAVQFVAYAGAIASAVIRNIPASCGCFGPKDSATADWPHVLFDIMLAAVAALIAYGAPGVLAVDRRLHS